MLGLCCCTWVFSSCSEWRLLSGCNEWASNCGASLVLGPWASVVVVHGLSCPQTCGIFLDQGWSLCPLLDRRILNHWTTREFLKVCFLFAPKLLHTDFSLGWYRMTFFSYMAQLSFAQSQAFFFFPSETPPDSHPQSTLLLFRFGLIALSGWLNSYDLRFLFSGIIIRSTVPWILKLTSSFC